MIYLIIGVALWIAAHLFKRAAPHAHARLGSRARPAVAVALVVSLGLMIYGYRAAEFVEVWSPPSGFTHLNNLLMLIAVFLFGMSATTGRLRGKLRHPMLLSVIVWAIAHLLVNGDIASIVLFGSMLAWAGLEIIVINRATPWQRPEPGASKKDIVLVIMTIVMFALIAGIHILLGVNPFG